MSANVSWKLPYTHTLHHPNHTAKCTEIQYIMDTAGTNSASMLKHAASQSHFHGWECVPDIFHSSMSPYSRPLETLPTIFQCQAPSKEVPQPCTSAHHLIPAALQSEILHECVVKPSDPRDATTLISTNRGLKLQKQNQAPAHAHEPSRGRFVHSVCGAHTQHPSATACNNKPAPSTNSSSNITALPRKHQIGGCS